MNRFRISGALARAVVVVTTVGVVATGVTFAALQSQQAVLTGNSIQSATADLRIGTSSNSFASSRSGFAFDNVIPGGPAVPSSGDTFYLKNYGTVALSLKLSVGSTPTNSSNVDLSKVTVELTRVDTGTVQTASLQSLIDPNGGLALTDTLDQGTMAQYTVRMSMADDAVSGNTGVSIDNIDFVFVGTVPTATE